MSSPLSAPRPVAKADLGISLCEAPERYFDLDIWREFLSYFEGREEALDYISRREPGIIGYYRQLAVKLETPGGAFARREEWVAEIGGSLIGAFKKRLIGGQLIATGFSRLAIERVTIPGERWSDFWPNFIENRADGSELKFTNVRIFEPTDTPTQRTDLLDRCIDWMRKRNQEGESRRKVLSAEALEHFGQELTTRTFGAAYKSVFGKPRGRPRTSGLDSNEPRPASQGDGTQDPLRVEPRPGEGIASHGSVRGAVKMVAPQGVTHVQTITGRQLLVRFDRTIDVSEEEARPLRLAGFVAAERPK